MVHKKLSTPVINGQIRKKMVPYPKYQFTCGATRCHTRTCKVLVTSSVTANFARRSHFPNPDPNLIDYANKAFICFCLPQAFGVLRLRMSSSIMLNHSNGIDCAPFSRLLLELSTIKQYNDTHKNRHKKIWIINWIFSWSNVVLSELDIICMRCACVCAIIITGLIVHVPPLF